MRLLRVVLFLVAILCLGSISRADSVGVSGTYAISGYATMVGNVPTGCGYSPCVEALQFSFVMKVESYGGTFCGGGACYDDQIIGGPGVTAAIGPMTGPWTVSLGSPQDAGSYLSLLTPTIELDLLGFYSPVNFVPESGTRIDSPYECLDPACLSFYGLQWPNGYQGSISYYTTTVTQTPEPPTTPLLLIGFVAILGAWGQSQRQSCGCVRA